ncbi:MAG: MinD/ParA family protein [Deltaproteobacteria bacterium]|nr:MinD/ParA family protein [Deltaproteobacteria bacterium]
MNQKDSSNKVISLFNKIEDKNNNCKSNARVISITSGKGGVGKTNIVVNLGFALSRLGKKVLILDADLGLGNLDILLGIAPKYNFSHVITGEKTISDITIEVPGKMKIIPASSGIQELTRLSQEQKIRILTELDLMIDPVDVLLIDTATGISSNVMYFNSAAQEIMVVVSPELTSITDAYALMKLLSNKYSVKHFKLLVNMAKNIQEAQEIFRNLNLVVKKFLDISIQYIGHVSFDENVRKSVKRQKVVSELYPDTRASKCFESMAKKICISRESLLPKGNTNFFWENVLHKKHN